jgi:hypothetical protein
MYLGTVYVSTKFQPDRTSNMATILKNQLRAIDMQLCTYVPLAGNSNSQTKFQSSLILSLVTTGLKPKTQKVLKLLN